MKRKLLPNETHPEAPTQAPPTEVPQIEAHTQREELGNMASSQHPPASTPAGLSRSTLGGTPRGRPVGGGGTCRGSGSHVGNSGVGKPSYRGGRGRSGMRGSGRGETYSGMESTMSSWAAKIAGTSRIGRKVDNAMLYHSMLQFIYKTSLLLIFHAVRL